MTDDLRTMLLGSLDREARRFEAEHPADEAGLYGRAIAPRRAARRAVEATGVVAVVAAVAAGLTVIAQPRAAVDEVPPAVTSTQALLARDWLVPGAARDEGSEAAELAEVWGPGIAEVRACALLDTYGALAGRADLGGEPVALGTVSPRGGVGANGVHVRSFAGPGEAQEYLAAATQDATRCAGAAATQGVGVTVADVGIGATAGTGTRIDVDLGVGSTWSLWIHLQEDEAVAVVVEPGAEGLAPNIITAWFAAGT